MCVCVHPFIPDISHAQLMGPKQKPVLCIPEADIQEPALHKGALGV